MNEEVTRILLVEDDKDHAELVARAFEQQRDRFHLTVVGSLAEARTCLSKAIPDLIFADLRLPDGLGTALLPGSDEEPIAPIVVITSEGDEEAAVEAIKAGALDYRVKSEEVLADTPQIAERILREWRYITQQKTAGEAERRWTQETEVMAEIGRTISSSLDINDVYEELGEQILELIPYDQFRLSQINNQNQTTSRTWLIGASVPGRNPGGAVPLAGTLAGEVVRTRAPVMMVAETAAEIEDRLPLLMPAYDAGLRSFLSVPLIHRDVVIGVLQIRSKSIGAYSEGHANIAARIADQIAGAVANSQLFAEVTRAQAAMKVSEQKYHTLVDESPDMVFVSRIGDFRLTEVNDRACEHYGYTRQQFLTLNIFDLEVEPLLEEEVRSFYDNTPVGHVVEVYGTNKRRDGATFPVHVRFAKLDDDYAIANVRDITLQKEAEEVRKQWAEESSAMAEIGRVIGSSLDIDEVNLELAETIRQLIPFDRLSLTLINQGRGTANPRWGVWSGVPGHHLGEGFNLKGSIAEEILKHKIPVVVDAKSEMDILHSYPKLLETFRSGFRSFLAVPLFYRGNVFATFLLQSKTQSAYTPSLVRLSERISNQIAGAIANSQLYAEHIRLAEENSVIAEIGRIIGSSLDISNVFEDVFQAMGKLVPIDRIGISLADLEHGTLTFAYLSGLDVPEKEIGQVFPIPTSFAGRAIKYCGSQVLHASTEIDLEGFGRLLPDFQAGHRSFLAVPLISQGSIVGVLRLSSTTPDVYTHEVVEIVEKIAAHIAPGLENARLYGDQQKSLREKEVLLQEINHRVKNNLQIIISLLSLQSQGIQDEQALNSFQVTQDRIRAMALVHDKLYRSDDLARIDFGDYINTLAEDLKNSYGLGVRDIRLKIDVEEILLGVDTAIPCGVIVNELVANALKHAFPGGRGGEIVVTFKEVDSQYMMVFRDNGVGFPEGLDINHTSSLGLTIVNALTGQLGGAIQLVRNGGSEIRITFPTDRKDVGHGNNRDS